MIEHHRINFKHGMPASTQKVTYMHPRSITEFRTEVQAVPSRECERRFQSQLYVFHRIRANSLKIAKSFVTEAMDFYRQVPRFHPPFLHQTYHLTFGLELFQSRLLSTPRNPGSTARPLVGSPVSVGEGETSSSRRIAPIATLSDL
jgi:hypothetical protein